MKGRTESIKKLAEKLYPSKEIGKQEFIETSRKLELLGEYNYVIKKRKGRNVSVEITNDGRKVISLYPIAIEK